MKVAYGPKIPVLVLDGELKCNNQINIGLHAIVRNIIYFVPGVNAGELRNDDHKWHSRRSRHFCGPKLCRCSKSGIYAFFFFLMTPFY